MRVFQNPGNCMVLLENIQTAKEVCLFINSSRGIYFIKVLFGFRTNTGEKQMKPFVTSKIIGGIFNMLSGLGGKLQIGVGL